MLGYPLTLLYGAAILHRTAGTGVTEQAGSRTFLGTVPRASVGTVGPRQGPQMGRPPSSLRLQSLSELNPLQTSICNNDSTSLMLCFFIQDALVKQGMYTQYAENLLKSVSDMVNSPRYDVTLAKTSIVSLMPHIQTEGKLSEIKTVMLLPYCINKKFF